MLTSITIEAEMSDEQYQTFIEEVNSIAATIGIQLNPPKVDYKPNESSSDEERNYYCKKCGSCGETGCCSPTKCIFHPDGEYCGTYLDELRLKYIVNERFYDEFIISKKLKEGYSKIYREEFDVFHKQNQTN